ncbi:MAG: hypothetical protein QOG10_2096 [Kribbellaceae bacterium]|jgi:hypothetical protein|nr:hypothetical protein [Kribbellaceae bacterium]
MRSSRYSGPGSEYAAWMDAFQDCYADPGGMAGVQCPHCARSDLRLIFIVPDQIAESGTAVFWCDHCLFGLMPARALLPSNGERVLAGKEEVPNYSIVADDSPPID